MEVRGRRGTVQKGTRSLKIARRSRQCDKSIKGVGEGHAFETVKLCVCSFSLAKVCVATH